MIEVQTVEKNYNLTDTHPLWSVDMQIINLIKYNIIIIYNSENSSNDVKVIMRKPSYVLKSFKWVVSIETCSWTISLGWERMNRFGKVW